MDEQFDALRKAFGEAGIDVPDDPTAMPLEALDELVADRRQRGACKSALMKFRRAAEASGWSASDSADTTATAPAEVPAAAVLSEVAPAPEPPPAPEPTMAAELITAAEPVAERPMSAELAARHEAMAAAFAAAGAPLPDDPVSFDLNSLDAMVEDKKQRGQVKSALMKFIKLAKEEGWTAGTATAAPTMVGAEGLPPQAAMEPPAGEPTPSAAGLGETVDPAALPGAPQPAEPPAAAAPTPMSPDLQQRWEAVLAAFEAAGSPVPADPMGFDLNLLDEQIEDKKLRGQIKSSLAKFRRLAGEEGWQAAPAPSAAPATPAIAASAAAAAPAAPSAADAPAAAEPQTGPLAVPRTAPSDLWMLGTDGWVKLGTATRQPTLTDEIVGQKTDSGATRRITNILILDGQFTVPEDLYNTFCYLAHEGVVYKAYYISHVGDVKRGTRTASLKVDETYDYSEFARAYEAMARQDRPTADDARLHRFGKRYRADRGMFLEEKARLI